MVYRVLVASLDSPPPLQANSTPPTPEPNFVLEDPAFFPPGQDEEIIDLTAPPPPSSPPPQSAPVSQQLQPAPPHAPASSRNRQRLPSRAKRVLTRSRAANGLRYRRSPRVKEEVRRPPEARQVQVQALRRVSKLRHSRKAHFEGKKHKARVKLAERRTADVHRLQRNREEQKRVRTPSARQAP